MSEDLDEIGAGRSLKNTKGRKMSRSIEHISTAGNTDSASSDIVMKSDGSDQIEESKFAPKSKARAPSPKVIKSMTLKPKKQSE